MCTYGSGYVYEYDTTQIVNGKPALIGKRSCQRFNANTGTCMSYGTDYTTYSYENGRITRETSYSNGSQTNVGYYEYQESGNITVYYQYAFDGSKVDIPYHRVNENLVCYHTNANGQQISYKC